MMVVEYEYGIPIEQVGKMSVGEFEHRLAFIHQWVDVKQDRQGPPKRGRRKR